MLSVVSLGSRESVLLISFNNPMAHCDFAPYFGQKRTVLCEEVEIHFSETSVVDVTLTDEVQCFVKVVDDQ